MPLAQFLTAQFQDYLRANLFSVYFDPIFTVPPNIGKIEYGSILVRTAQIPGQTINTNYVLYNNKRQHFAESIDLDPITMDIFCDTGNKAHGFLTYWQSKVISPMTRVKNYKTEYVGKVEIAQHTRPLLIAGVEAVTATLINAFPINVTPVELSTDSQDTIAQFSATFIFDDVQFTFKNGFISSLLSFGVGGAGIAGLL